MTENTIKAKALIIGRELARSEWWKLSSKDADSYCKTKAETMGVTDDYEKQLIAVLAMGYVINRGEL